MFRSDLSRKRVIGLLLLAALLALFLWFNRIPKLDTVQQDLVQATAPLGEAQCFQGLCIDGNPESSLLERWWRFSLTYLRLVALGMTFAFLMAGLTEAFLFPPESRPRWGRRGLKGSLQGLLVPVVSRGVAALGWREVILYTGIFVAVVVIPLSLLIRRSPESVGINLAESVEAAAPPPSCSAAPPSRRDYSVREALRTPAYWLILLASALRISVTSGILVHGIPIMVWKGASEQAGADFVGLLFFVSIPARFLLGMSGVRLPGRWILAAGMAVGAASVLALDYVPGLWVVYPFVVGIAILEGAAVQNWVVVGDYFGRRNFATLTGVISVFYSAGMMLSPLFLGWLFDRTGGYTLALLTLALLYAASALLFAAARAPGQLRISN